MAATARFQTVSQRQRRHKEAVEKIIRGVEDNIQRQAQGPRADQLEREFLERLEDPELEADILDNRPIHEIIAEICRDLRVTPPSDPAGHYKRRTPADVQSLRELAKRLARHAASAQSGTKSDTKPGPKPDPSAKPGPAPTAPHHEASSRNQC